MPSTKNPAKAHIKRHFWLPMIMIVFLMKGKATKAQDSDVLDYDQECVNSCFWGFEAALETYCPGSNEENGVYDCAATSCDMTKEMANMYIAGYMIQSSKANNTFCVEATQTTSRTASLTGTTSSTSPTLSTSSRASKTTSDAQPVKTAAGPPIIEDDPSADPAKTAASTGLASLRGTEAGALVLLLVTAAMTLLF